MAEAPRNKADKHEESAPAAEAEASLLAEVMEVEQAQPAEGAPAVAVAATASTAAAAAATTSITAVAAAADDAPTEADQIAERIQASEKADRDTRYVRFAENDIVDALAIGEHIQSDKDPATGIGRMWLQGKILRVKGHAADRSRRCSGRDVEARPQVLVHFKGHNSIYDEWLDLPLANSGSDSDVRLALAGERTGLPPKMEPLKLTAAAEIVGDATATNLQESVDASAAGHSTRDGGAFAAGSSDVDGAGQKKEKKLFGVRKSKGSAGQTWVGYIAVRVV